MKRMLAAALFALAFALLPVASAQGVTLEFPCWQAEEPGFAEWWKGLIADYEGKHPGVKIKLYSLPFASYVNQLTVRFAGDNPPDILLLPTRNFASFASQGWLEPLDTELKASDILGHWSKLQSEMDWNGKTYGVLLLPYGNLLYYNERMLHDANVKVPTTPSEWLEAMAKTTHRDQGVFGLVTTTAEHPNMFIDAATWVLGEKQDWLKGDKYSFTDPGVIAAMEQFRKSLSYAPPGTSSTVARQLFIEGKAAFLRDGPWVWATLQKAKPEIRASLRMAPLPFAVVTGGASNGLHIPARLDAQKKKLVWEFILLAASPAWQAKYVQLTGSPAGRVGMISPAQANADPHLAAIIEAAEKAQNLFPQQATLRENFNEFATLFSRAVMRMQASSEPTATILANLQKELVAAIPLP
ncbi:MAG TPA: extracellular solute-binding protein [Casimicrobiaceae bacterium]|jgi:multiple sugar transport system substrate-binding protein|nr:extracellular solute-binding protein [Casimicrobiaceae bacterium]